MKRWRAWRTSVRSLDGSDAADRGAVLVLALIFVVAVGLMATALATWATNDLNNAKTFTNVEALHSDATGMMKMAVQYVRHNPVISTTQAANVASPAVACWGGTDVSTLPVIDGDQVAVWCSTVWNPGLATTRVVTFYACSAVVPVSVCTSPGKALLTEVVTFDDYPVGTNAPNQTLCSANVTCGIGMTVQNSSWGPALVDAQANVAASASFIVEPSSTIVNQATTAQVKILDAQGLPLSGETVTLTVQGTGSLSSTSTLSEVTNVAGVADFNSLVPTAAGALILQATDGSVSASSTSFSVGPGANAITILAATPGPTLVGTVITLTPSPSATATSGQAVVVSGTAGICSTSGDNLPGDHVSVTAISGGTCVLTFTDAGNANYVAATPVTMSFSVLYPPAVTMSLTATATVTASNTTNDGLTLVLLDKNGTPTHSNGTTVVTFSETNSSGQAGSGYFADHSGVSSPGNETSVSFSPGQMTAYAYFGDMSAESVTVTASSSGLASAQTTIQVTPSTPSQIAVTPATTSAPASAASNLGVSLSIEDQFGNVVTLSSPATVSLSSTFSSTGATTGFFTAANNSSTALAGNAVTVPAGPATATVYFGDTTATPTGVSVNLGASSSGKTGSAAVSITPLAPVKVLMVWSNTTISASSITNTGFTVELVDKYNNVTAPTGSTTYSYTLSTNAPNTKKTYYAFFSTSSNGKFGGGGSAQTTWPVTLSASNPTQVMYFAVNQSGHTVTVSLQPQSGGTFSAAQVITVN